jgi:hypothetical protein
MKRMTLHATKPAKVRLRKVDVLKEFDNIERRVALALGISAQAVSDWGPYVPELSARKLIDLYPALKAKAKYVAA